jgi:hypothetical protein
MQSMEIGSDTRSERHARRRGYHESAYRIGRHIFNKLEHAPLWMEDDGCSQS